MMENMIVKSVKKVKGKGKFDFDTFLQRLR